MAREPPVERPEPVVVPGGVSFLLHPCGAFHRYMIGSQTYVYADGAALSWPKAIGGTGPSGVVLTSVGPAEAPAEIVAWHTFWGRGGATRAIRRAPGSDRDRLDARRGRLGLVGERFEGCLRDLTTRGVQRDALPSAGSQRGVGFDPESVVHGASELLFAPDVPLRRLDGDVSQVQPSASFQAERREVRRP
jgi:hypothetical protein